VLRIAVADDSREAVERFSRELMPLVTAGPQGTTGYAEGRPRVHPMFRFWPCLIERERVTPRITFLQPEDQMRPGKLQRPHESAEESGSKPVVADSRGETERISKPPGESREPRWLGDIATARSGDKGIHANIGVIARRPQDFTRLCREVTAQRVASFLGLADASRVVRYELPNLAALNLVIHGILANPLRVDAQGKALGQVLLEMPLEEREEADREL
jgi:hypothetical protein